MASAWPVDLQKLRAASGLSIDADGRFCHLGEPITHGRTLSVLWGSLFRQAGGGYAVRVGRELASVRVADEPYGVRGVTWDAGWPLLHLTDGAVERLDPASLALGGDGVLRCRVMAGAHGARFQRGAQVELGLALEEEPEGTGRFTLRLGPCCWPVRG